MRPLFSILFVVLLIIPSALGFMDLGAHPPDSKSQTKTPGWQLRGLLDPDYYRSWQNYLERHLTHLPTLTATKRQLDFRLFAMTDVPNLHVGREGWVFDQQAVGALRKDGCDLRRPLQQLLTDMQAVAFLLKAGGRRLMLGVIPDKATIYPEYVGAMPPNKACGKSGWDIWLELNKRTPWDGFVRLDQPLLAVKDSAGPLYPKTGTTLTWAAAHIATQTVMDALINGKFAPEETADFEARLFGSPTHAGADPEIQKATQKWSAVLVYGDPVPGPLIAGLTQRFDRVDVIQSATCPSTDHDENIADYDAIVVVVKESRLADLRMDVDRWYAMLSADDLATVKNNLLPTISAHQLISIDKGPDGLAIKSLGTGASFSLSALPGSQANTLRLLKLIIRAPKADELTWSAGDTALQEGQRYLRPGQATLYIPLPRRPWVRLNIHPGKNAGIFHLSNATLLEFHSTDPVNPPQDQQLQTITTGKVTTAKIILPAPPNDAEAKPQAMADTGPPALSLHDFEEGAIFQRKGKVADIVISGTYTGHPTAIEARVLHHVTGQPIVPWAVIDKAPGDGVFMGVLTAVPQGGWYRVAVRFSRQHAIEDQGEKRWGVGILVACLGQSNMKEWFYTGGEFKPHPLSSLHRQGRWQPDALGGNGATAFANRLIARLGIPVGLLDYAVNGSGLCKKADWGKGYWTDQEMDGIYKRFIADVANAGGAVEYVLWLQGEADAARGTISEHEYHQNLVDFIEEQIRKDLINGSRLSRLPFLVIGMVRRPIGKDAPHQAVRNAQTAATQDLGHCYLAATTLDLKNQGRQHLAPGAYTILGLRVAQTVLYLLGEASYFRGPSVMDAHRIDDQHIGLRLVHRGGSDFSPETGITGWQVLSDQTAVPLSAVERYDAQTIRIRLAEPTSHVLTIRYLYGAMPDVRRPVIDNSTLALPLEAFELVLR